MVASLRKTRSLVVACVTHALHDGYTDALYAFLPVWQSQYRLSFAGLAVVRALYYGTMGGLQLPGDRVTRRLSSRTALALSTALAASGFVLMALPLGFVGLCFGLVLAGIGSSVQHPRGSLLVVEAFEGAARRPLGIYNFSGDLGKASLPALAALLLPVLAWRPVAGLLAFLGLLVSASIVAFGPAHSPRSTAEKTAPTRSGDGRGFRLLMAIGAFDTATRMGYLLFLPFLVQARGGTSGELGLGLALLFVGGALGKATCSWLGEKLGVVGAVVATEAATALLIVATLFAPLGTLLVLLPLLGVMLNGTSSVLYGTVPELAPRGDNGRAFALFYTGVIGSGGLAPILYGAVADHTSRTVGVLTAAATAALIVPLALALRPSLEPSPLPAI